MQSSYAPAATAPSGYFLDMALTACRHCHKAVYAPQKYDQIGRKRLAAAKLRLELGGWPDIREPVPQKAKWKHRKRYQRL